MTSASTPPTLDLGRHLRTQVDGCFEEGQYETGLRLLEQLRHEHVKPYSPHVRQLLCMALYPSSTTTDPTPAVELDLLPSSPRKLIKQAKEPSHPSPRDADLAQSLLMSIAATSLPFDIFCALPGYNARNDWEDDDAESVIADQALALVQCKTCWEFLTPDFCARQQATTKSRKGRRARDEALDTSLDDQGPISKTAWPVLEWLVVLYEKDQAISYLDDASKEYSQHLLHQIPPPKGESGTRWETDAPLDIAFFCMTQTEPRRRMLGTRLLRLVINLTQTAEINFQMLVARVLSHFLIFTTQSDLNETWTGMGNSICALRFKISLAMKYIIDQQISSPATRKPRAQPRAARPKGAEDKVLVSRASLGKAPVHAAYAAADVLQALELAPSGDNPTLFAWFRIRLAETYHELHTIASPDQQDPSWTKEALEQAAKFQGDDQVVLAYMFNVSL
ncbi:hypothetical protein DL96DRAFT_1162839 [Flagelloscypha sp. PMI_526]|nr:hypothetical protein DL96DRAFT_1162839 [Flagelloscypha sp. PMI_526]